MAILSLPLSFTNSFWTQDYRKGLEILFKKLQQGTVENDEIIAFIRARAGAEANLAASLMQTTGAGPTDGFAADDGATLLMAFRGLQAETAKQAEAHRSIANDLSSLVVQPFAEWTKSHKDRLNSAQNTLLEGQLRAYENGVTEVAKLKEQYLTKVRKADEAEDDAKFAPSSEVNGDKFTTSPRLGPVDAHSPPKRSGTVSERISARLKDIQKKTAAATHSTSDSVSSLASEKEKPLDDQPRLDKGKGRATDEPPPVLSPLAMSPLAKPKELDAVLSPSAQGPPPMLLAGLSFPPASVSNLLLHAREQLPLRPVRLPILGEYQDCFTGEELVVWLRDHVDGFGGSFDLAEEAARDITERDNLLRRIGELRNFFEASDEALYQFRPRAFELGHAVPPSRRGTGLSDSNPSSPSIIKRSNQFLSVVSNVLAADKEPRHVRARQEADQADNAYRVAVRRLDRLRLVLEQRIEEALKLLQQLETERLRAVKTCLLQYHGTLSNLPRALEPSITERSAAHIAAFVPEADLAGLMERYRTGPFRPHPQIYASVAHDESDVLFGIDLRRWADGGWGVLVGGQEPKEKVPPIVVALLGALDKAYPKLTSDDERRKSWIYEVPLRAVHHARETLNAIGPDEPIPEDALAKYDAPVLASTIKLWLLELDPPLALWEGWDDLRKIYPVVGSGKTEGQSDQERIQALQVALQRWPKVHLYVLEAIVTHIRKVIESTQVEEPNEVYITKLALSFARTIVRPKQETTVSLQDRHPAAFFIDIITYYEDLILATIEKKKSETERRKPIRKRTAPIDLRMSRSRLSVGTDARDWLAQQRTLGNIPPPVPKLTTPVPPSAAGAAEPAPAPPQAPAPNSEAAKLAPSLQIAREKPVPPAPVPTQSPPAPTSNNSGPPPRPSFKEPPPEDEGLPPRPPMFKEPDLGDVSPVTRPAPSVIIPETTPEPPLAPEIEEPDPSMFSSPTGRNNASRAESPRLTVRAPTLPDSGNRSPSPLASEERPINPNRASVARAGSNDPSRLRGPRGSRPPRTGGGSVSQMVSNLNKRDSVGSGSGSPSPGASGKRTSTGRPLSGISDSKRTSLSGRGALSSRTMDSDAEDIVG